MPAPNYYEILGLTPNATADQVKRRFRELARRYHPDVARTPDATEQFKLINEANQVLGDPDRRRDYDATLRLAQMRSEAPAPARSAASSASPYAARSAPASAQPTASGTSATTGSARPAPPGPTQKADVDSLIQKAQVCMKKMKYGEAELYCKQALKINRNVAAAYEILGDVYRARNDGDKAVSMYTFALQLDKSNAGLRAKFERATGIPTGKSGPTMAGNAARAARTSPSSEAWASGDLPVALPARILVTSIGAGTLLFLLVMVFEGNARIADNFQFWAWRWQGILALTLGGCVSGLLLSVNGYIGLAREELALSGGGSGAPRVIPFGFTVVALSMVSYFLAAATYFGVSMKQDAVSPSMSRTFLVTFAVVGLVQMFRLDSFPWILFMGGNLVFPSFVAGWIAGDTFRS